MMSARAQVPDLPLLKVKFHVPPVRAGLVPRSRLVRRLNAGLDHKLTLVSAPAGFGKTTLVSQWIASCRRGGPRSERRGTDASSAVLAPASAPLQVAWLSLDEGDNDPTRFLTYLVAALQAGAGVGSGALGVLQASRPQPPPVEAILTALINEIAALPSRIVLVLDDYHLLDSVKADGAGPASASIHQALTFLLDHLPPQLHLVLLTRSDPPLPLARLRGRGELMELREPDLRFARDEAKALLDQVAGLDLDQTAVDVLERRTEGWAVGLHLAGLALRSLALQTTAEVTAYIAEFAGDHTYVIDYLADEVLDRQPEHVQAFLLQTSILDRLSGPLCDAVCSVGAASGAKGAVPAPSSQEMLTYLAQNNLFLLSLDDRRQWYRYHHLFVDLLRYRLKQTQPDRVPDLHRRASAWCADHDFVEDALHHALAAGDHHRAADMIQSATATMLGQGEMATLKSWIERLPEAVVLQHPGLCVTQAWAFDLAGQHQVIEPRLQDAERALQKQALDQRAEAEIRGGIALLRGHVAEYQNDLPRAIELLQEALACLPRDHFPLRTVANMRLGTLYKYQNAWEAAAQALRQAQTLGETGGNLYGALYAGFTLAEVMIVQGRLREGAKLCQEIIDRYLPRQGEQVPPILGPVYIALGQILYEWNDLKGAAHALDQGIALGESSMAVWPAMRVGLSTYSWLKQIRGEPGGAQALMERAIEMADRVRERLGKTDVAARQARLWLAQAKLAAAVHWARAHQASEAEARSGLSEVTLSRVLLAQGKADEALDVLAPLGQRLQAAGRVNRLIEVLSLRALVHQAQDEVASALETLGQALALAEPEGYCRTFVDEGPEMAALLAQCLLQTGTWADQDRPCSADYVRQLLAAFPSRKPEPGAVPSRPESPALAYLPDPLNDREIEVLNLVAAGLSTPEIAGKLILAPSTVKWHLRNIYSKLGVHRRFEAVAQAQTLGLLQ